MKSDAHVTHGLPCGACLVAGSILVPTPAEVPGPSVEPVAEPSAYASTDSADRAIGLLALGAAASTSLRLISVSVPG